MFYNIIPDFSPVMAAKIKYRFEIAKIMADGFMKDYYIKGCRSLFSSNHDKMNVHYLPDVNIFCVAACPERTNCE